MIGNNTRTWVGGTAVLTVLALLVTWFLLISPQRAQAAELRQQALDLQGSNDLLVSQTAQLEQQFSHLPELQDELTDLRASVPATLGLSDLTRQFSAAAAATGATLVSIAPGAPTSATTATAAPAADATTTTTDAAATTTATATAAAAPGAASGVVATPLVLEVVGSPSATTAFAESVQTAPRAFLVTALSVTAEEEGEASGGRPATEQGDVTLTLTGSAFVLPAEPTAAAAATTTPAS